MRLGWIWLCVIVLSFASLLPGAGENWKVGLANVKITPAEPVLMYGYANRLTPHTGVMSDLYVKAMALEDEAGSRAVLVTCDLGGVHGEMIERIAGKLMVRHNLSRESIVYNASHTHAGPLPWVARDDMAGVAPEHVEATKRYAQWLEMRLEAVADAAMARMEPGRISWSTGVATFVMNRRQHTAKGIVLGFNPAGPVDRSVLVLRVDGADGKPRAVLMGCACHCTSSGPGNFKIDGDYAGYAQSILQERLAGAQAMFMTGCGGDANPHPRGDIYDAKKHGETLANEVWRAMHEKMTAVRGPLRCAIRRVDLPLTPPRPRAELEQLLKSGGSWQKYTASRHLKMLQAGQSPAKSYTAPLAMWRFGEGLTLVGLSGEPVNDYVHLFEKAIGPLDLWVAGYCNDVWGYLPSVRILEEGGYETRGIDRGDAVGQFDPAVQQAIIGAIVEMARQTGRVK